MYIVLLVGIILGAWGAYVFIINYPNDDNENDSNPNHPYIM